MHGTFYHVDTAALSLATFLDTIDRTFFTPNFGTYEHLTFFNDPTMFKILIIGIYIGLIIASLFTFYNRRILGEFVRKLDSEGALSPETAKTLEELGYSKKRLVKLSLKRGYSLRRVISYTSAANTDENEEIKGENLANASTLGQKVDLSKDKFYLPEEKRDITVSRFRAKGSGPLSIVLLAVIGLVAVVLIFKIAPIIVNLLDSAVQGFSNEPDVLN